MASNRELSPAAFAHSLGRLRDAGTTILVVGAVGSPGHQLACETFRGTSADPEILIGTHGRWSEWWTEGGQGTFLAYDADWRSATHASHEGDDERTPTPRSWHQTPDGVASAVEDVVSEVGVGDESTRPRLCMESASPLLANHPRANVREALERIGAAIRSVRGFGHVHLPVAPDHDAVAAVSAAFRCQVELEGTDEGLRHRWIFPERAVTSGWYRLSPEYSP